MQLKIKNLIILFFLVFTFFANGQNKFNYSQLRDLQELKGTEFMVANFNEYDKTESNRYQMLFINALNGQVKQIDFPAGTIIDAVKQVKIDEKGINKLLVTAKTLNRNGNKKIDWNDPRQVIAFSPDGQEWHQLTPDDFNVQYMVTNEMAGTLVITGFFDANNNNKQDEIESHELLVFDLASLQQKARTRLHD